MAGAVDYARRMIRLHDSATGAVRELALREPGKVGMYVCGPTVYGPPHIGHGRFSLVFDVLRRYLEWSGFEVNYVSNITDIDDKIINRAASENRPWTDIAHKCESIWTHAMDRMNIKRPTSLPHATEYVGEMVALINDLVARGKAYATSDGMYLAVQSVDDYGLLARQSLDDMLAGGGDRAVLGAAEKKHPADFALWKFTKPGEPSWPANFGDGRPGWHTECVVMSLDLLGEGFDIHGGGQDLRFPHHENERAQAVAIGKTFAGHWVHNGFIVDPSGEKMSKSLNNFTNLLDFLDSVDSRAYRMLVLQGHYRSPMVVDNDAIAQAQSALATFDTVGRRSVDVVDGLPAADAIAAFTAYMDDDMNTPQAVALMFDLAKRINSGIDAGADVSGEVNAFRSICSAVGLELATADDVPTDVAAQAQALDDLRAAKDFAAADAIRAMLSQAGWIVETTKAGTTVRRS